MTIDDLKGVLGPPRKVTVAIPMPYNPEVMRCIKSANAAASFVLIGDVETISLAAENEEVDLSYCRLVNIKDEEEACDAAAALAGTGQADLLMKGLTQTSTFTRAVLDKSNNLMVPGRLLSHVALFDIPAYHKALAITDAAIHIYPGVDEKREIMLNAIEVCRLMGIAVPKIALIAPVEKVNPKIRSTVDADELVRLADGGTFGEVLVGGPMGFDVAVSGHAAGVKSISSSVAGDPDILLLPNLDCANAVYKALTCFASARVASVLAGARVPVVLTSRADSDSTKSLSLALCITLACRADNGSAAP